MLCSMSERTPDGAVWNYFNSAREKARLHSLIRDLRLPFSSGDDMVQMTFSQSFVIILEVVAGDDVRFFDFSVPSSFF